MSEAVEALVGAWYAEHPEIESVFWFGSWVTGKPSPRSDVDLCIVVNRSDELRHERIVHFLPLEFPTGLDLVVYTSDEFDALGSDLPAWAAAIRSGRVISRDDVLVAATTEETAA